MRYPPRFSHPKGPAPAGSFALRHSDDWPSPRMKVGISPDGQPRWSLDVAQELAIKSLHSIPRVKELTAAVDGRTAAFQNTINELQRLPTPPFSWNRPHDTSGFFQLDEGLRLPGCTSLALVDGHQIVPWCESASA